jgi:hypothetical protein
MRAWSACARGAGHICVTRYSCMNMQAYYSKCVCVLGWGCVHALVQH